MMLRTQALIELKDWIQFLEANTYQLKIDTTQVPEWIRIRIQRLLLRMKTML